CFVRLVSFAASAEEANYTPAPEPRQHLLREKLKEISSEIPKEWQATENSIDMKKGYLASLQTNRNLTFPGRADGYAPVADSATLACVWHAMCLPWTLYICSNSMF
ncbi:hypothetical protein, partial [Chromobacterium amazonense]|uniref:hypothetical protein n=2 Tax=Chromobacterium amazonense TaxID=1382803 RepID=UPI001CB8BEDE